MTTRPESSPISPRRPSWPRRAGVAALWSSVLLLQLSLAASIYAQRPFADIAFADHAPSGDSLAYHALQEGRVENAATLLRVMLAANPSDATAHELLCRVAYTQDQVDAAVSQCELAVSNDPSNSGHHLWLGRAYGMKARRAGPIAGFRLARRVQANFARAVEIDPNNIAALNDLGEYDVAAPFIVGGGSDKARALAARMMPRFPAAAHRLLARLAESEDDLTAAESEFRKAVEVQGSPGAWIDLARFYQANSRPDEALAAVKSAIAADWARDDALVDAAGILTAAHRDPDLAERCLRDYLASSATSDAAPVFKVHLQLSRLLAARGDNADAHQEIETAATLAPSYTRTARSARGS